MFVQTLNGTDVRGIKALKGENAAQETSVVVQHAATVSGVKPATPRPRQLVKHVARHEAKGR
jgi:hypothetical protein